MSVVCHALMNLAEFFAIVFMLNLQVWRQRYFILIEQQSKQNIIYPMKAATEYKKVFKQIWKGLNTVRLWKITWHLQAPGGFNNSLILPHQRCHLSPLKMGQVFSNFFSNYRWRAYSSWWTEVLHEMVKGMYEHWLYRRYTIQHKCSYMLFSTYAVWQLPRHGLTIKPQLHFAEGLKFLSNFSGCVLRGNALAVS